MNVSYKRIFYPLRPRKRRSRPPILGGQLKNSCGKIERQKNCGFKTKEQKNRFFEGQNGSVFLGRQKNIKTGFKVGCCFNEGLIRVLQTLALVGVVCRGYRFALPSVIFSLRVPCFARFYEQIFTPSDLAKLGLVPLFYGDSLLRQKNKRTGF